MCKYFTVNLYNYTHPSLYSMPEDTGFKSVTSGFVAKFDIFFSTANPKKSHTTISRQDHGLGFLGHQGNPADWLHASQSYNHRGIVHQPHVKILASCEGLTKEWLTKGVLLHNNMLVHKAQVAWTTVHNFKQLEDQLTYSHDLASFNLLSSVWTLEIPPWSYGFNADEDALIDAMETRPNEQSESFHFTRIESLNDNRSKCIEVKRYFIMKKQS